MRISGGLEGTHVKVIFPFGGRWRMCRWHTENDGHHLILARTHAAILTAFKAVLEKQRFAEVRGYFDIEVLAPSAAMLAMDNAIRVETARREFWSYLTWESTSYFDDLGVYPPGVTACAAFEAADDYKDEIAFDYVPDPKHYGCKHCKDGVVIVAPDREAFYQARRAMFEASDHWLRCAHDEGKPAVASRATPAADGQALSVAIANFGHHAKGAHLTEFEMPESGAVYLPTGFSDVLFFYSPIGTLAADDMEAMARASEEAIRSEDKVEAERYQRERGESEIATRLELMAILKGPTT